MVRAFHARSLQLVATLVLTLTLACMCSAQTEQIIHTFGAADGAQPAGPLVFDNAGNLYGTTSTGGPNRGGTVFELSPSSGSKWRLSLLHAFPAFDTDGKASDTGLSFDAAGNLYGVARLGGVYGEGSVYQLSPSASGYKYKTIYSFRHTSSTVLSPTGPPAVDASGNLYGSAIHIPDLGTVIWQLEPESNGSWSETDIYTAAFGGTDISYVADMKFGPDGDLYGVSLDGGRTGYGAIFKLSPSSGGGWSETILYNFGVFGSEDGNLPTGMAFDQGGNIIGNANGGGAFNLGKVFEFPRNADGSWGPISTIHDFDVKPDGHGVTGAPTLDSAGDVYVNCVDGGTAGAGAALEFTESLGVWTEVKLHDFLKRPDGGEPHDGPTLDGSGNVYGLTSTGGTGTKGTVWEITP